MRSPEHPSKKVVELGALLRALQPRRAAGLRVALTNGCFDLLTRAHVRYLVAAAELADVLVVGLNSDASVHGLKEPGRPLVPQEERAEVLAGLSCVDYVTIFEDRTAEGLLRALRPEVYIKGGDYADRPPPEAEIAAQLGTEFRLVDLVCGSSTSDIVRRVLGSAPAEPAAGESPVP